MMVKNGHSRYCQSISLPKAKVSIQSFSWWSIRRSWQIRPSLRQMFLERRGISPGMFLLIHSWTDCSFFMQILLSAFSSRPRCSFRPNKTRTLFLWVCARMGLNQFSRFRTILRLKFGLLKNWNRNEHKTASWRNAHVFKIHDIALPGYNSYAVTLRLKNMMTSNSQDTSVNISTWDGTHTMSEAWMNNDILRGMQKIWWQKDRNVLTITALENIYRGYGAENMFLWKQRPGFLAFQLIV